MDDLAGYIEQLLYLHVPKSMSYSAELICMTYTCVNLSLVHNMMLVPA